MNGLKKKFCFDVAKAKKILMVQCLATFTKFYAGIILLEKINHIFFFLQIKAYLCKNVLNKS